MKIIRHYFIDDIVNRSEVEVDCRSYRRIVRGVLQVGELDPVIPDAPIWQEKYSGNWVPTLSDKAKELEQLFIEALIKENHEKSAN